MDSYGLSLVTAPTSEPVSREEAKLWCRIEADQRDEDDLLDAIIAGARRHVERWTEKALFTQTWRLTLDCFPSVIYVPLPPLASVTSITYLDTAGDSQTLSSSNYEVDTYSQPGRITPAYGLTWPSTRGISNSVTVTFVAGQAVASIEPDVKIAMRLLVCHWYVNREAFFTGTIGNAIEFGVKAILGLHEVGGYG